MKCPRCGKSVKELFSISLLTVVLCGNCHQEWRKYFSERFNKEHGTALGFHIPIYSREKGEWFKEFLNEQEKVVFT